MRNPSSPIPVAISMGDPLGVGPEVILKALGSREVAGKVIPIVVGLPSVMRRAASLVGVGAAIKFLSMDRVHEASETGVIYVISPERLLRVVGLSQTGRQLRAEDPASGLLRGKVASACVKEAANLCIRGETSALVTAPLSKASLEAAGIAYIGHTEMLRDLCRCKDTLMMFVRGRHRVSLVTTHIPIGRVKKVLTRRRLERAIILTRRGLELLFGVPEPRLAVLSLNPHRGEEGLLGCEEKNVIVPAMEIASQKGARVSGPFAADSFFSRGEWKKFDAVIAMYHDQGLIAAKLIGGERVTNLTLGLPFVRTSPGHGVAEDIAWKGIAEPQGMMSAILLAARLAGTVRLPLKWD
jgi:4-hydroxythreonine-4-phosphate dehydrogenase